MNEEKDFEKENNNEVAEEVTAEATEEIVNDDTVEVIEIAADEVPTDEGEAPVVEPVVAAEEKKPSVVSAVVITFLICAIAAGCYYFFGMNKYNRNPDGYAMTLQVIAERNNQGLDEFKDSYGLPKDMRGDTLLDVAQYYIPLSKIAENYGMTVEELKEQYNIAGENITDDMPIGEVDKIMNAKEEAEASAAAQSAAPENATATEAAAQEVATEAAAQ